MTAYERLDFRQLKLEEFAERAQVLIEAIKLDPALTVQGFQDPGGGWVLVVQQKHPTLVVPAELYFIPLSMDIDGFFQSALESAIEDHKNRKDLSVEELQAGYLMDFLREYHQLPPTIPA